MAITVTLYSFTKRENSTKRPSSGGTSYSCLMIDETSLMNPTFKLDLPANPIGKNYCYVSDFNRYYFITDIRTFRGFWYIDCTCDVLASFKTEIGPQTHYVLRSASSYDEEISDSLYPCKVVQTSDYNLSGSVMSWSSNHCYVLGITGFSEDILDCQTGSVTYYQFNDAALYNFIRYLMRNLPDYAHIEAQGYDDPGVQEALINPIQYIVSCIALPIPLHATTGSDAWQEASRIDFGYYTCPGSNFRSPATGAKVVIVPQGATYTESADVDIPKHPQASTRGKYLNGSPFTDYIFHCGPWGDIPLEPAALINSEKIHYEILYDVPQGNARLLISPKGTNLVPFPNIIYNGCAQVGVPIQINQVLTNPYMASHQYYTDVHTAKSTALGTAPSIVLGFNASGVQDLNVQKQNIIYNAVMNKYPNVSGVGSNGSMLSFKDIYKCYLFAKFFRIVDEMNAEIGRPLYQSKQINTLSGYILCQNADAQISGTQDEASKINTYLNTGFFYE